MTKILLSILVLVALATVLCFASPDKSSQPQKRAVSGTLYKRTMEEWHRTKRQSGTFNWDLNQMFDLFQKVSGGMGGSKRSLNKRQSGTMNWDLNQMFDLFTKVTSAMKSKREVD